MHRILLLLLLVIPFLSNTMELSKKRKIEKPTFHELAQQFDNIDDCICHEKRFNLIAQQSENLQIMYRYFSEGSSPRSLENVTIFTASYLSTINNKFLELSTVNNSSQSETMVKYDELNGAFSTMLQNLRNITKKSRYFKDAESYRLNNLSFVIHNFMDLLAKNNNTVPETLLYDIDSSLEQCSVHIKRLNKHCKKKKKQKNNLIIHH